MNKILVTFVTWHLWAKLSNLKASFYQLIVHMLCSYMYRTFIVEMTAIIHQDRNLPNAAMWLVPIEVGHLHIPS